MKILVINTVPFQRNGITTHIMNYCTQLANRGIEIDIGVNGEIDEKLKKQLIDAQVGINYYVNRKQMVISYMHELYKDIKKKKYDIVHVHGNSNTMFFDLFPAKLAGCKVRIAHSHNTTCDYLRLHKLLQIPFNISYNVGFACGDEAGKWLFKNKKFTVINNGIDLSKYKFDLDTRLRIRKKLHILEDEILLGHVGLFNYQKNHEFLIKLLRKLLDKKKNYKLICIGDGENKKEVEKLATEYGLKNQIIFTGESSNVVEYLQAMDLFVLPSRYEGLPYVLIEAQAVGLYCLVSENVDRKVNISKNVEFQSIDNVLLWEKKIITNAICQDLNLRMKLSEDAHRSIKKYGYDINMNAKRIEKIYSKLVEMKRT